MTQDARVQETILEALHNSNLQIKHSVAQYLKGVLGLQPLLKNFPLIRQIKEEGVWNLLALLIQLKLLFLTVNL